ncbi:hypothetical protein LPAF129_03860 [Ligilactobacillus pabuli]|uniref:Uncharacterized protein n=1 Tax=Ligilactobacillus pabuli TaxID=2886039 RepID=A0ABQ5JFT6_9LACO|nr:hypothetical protein [Ligilactobacillus pabuli]GKS80701.1 hypothetical protein LPAF129_03860 [Ligilactobacillus pabuli]
MDKYRETLHVIANMSTEQKISFLTRLLADNDAKLSIFERNDLQATITNLRKQREQHAKYKLGPQYGTGR